MVDVSLTFCVRSSEKYDDNRMPQIGHVHAFILNTLINDKWT